MPDTQGEVIKTGNVVNAGASLDIATAEELRISLLDSIAGQAGTVLNLSLVERCDIAGLQVLIAAGKTALADGKPFCLSAPSQTIIENAAAAGIVLPLLK